MSKSKAELPITKRLLLDFIKYKTNNNHTFFMGNDKIAAALGLTVNSAKVMVNELIREGYLLKSTDILCNNLFYCQLVVFNFLNLVSAAE